mmetsp:Transcript_69734/g.136866  ORF Transcript_69734/g.136866 Transcript_69734/m.136866 type:complete len:260 (+) Transcript_69734:2710-3489(+)
MAVAELPPGGRAVAGSSAGLQDCARGLHPPVRRQGRLVVLEPRRSRQSCCASWCAGGAVQRCLRGGLGVDHRGASGGQRRGGALVLEGPAPHLLSEGPVLARALVHRRGGRLLGRGRPAGGQAAAGAGEGQGARAPPVSRVLQESASGGADSQGEVSENEKVCVQGHLEWPQDDAAPRQHVAGGCEVDDAAVASEELVVEGAHSRRLAQPGRGHARLQPQRRRPRRRGGVLASRRPGCMAPVVAVAGLRGGRLPHRGHV